MSQSCGSQHLPSSHCRTRVMLLPFSCQPCSPLSAHGAVHTTTFLPVGPRGLPFNRQEQSWCWDSPPTSNYRFQQHRTQESDTKALSDCIYILWPPWAMSFLSMPLETAILTNQTCNCGIIFKPPTSSCFTDAETEAQRGPATCSASHSYCA